MSIAIPPGTDPFALLGQLRADLKASLMYVVAWMAIVVFDYLATLPLEIRYIWPSKLSPLKIIFLALRYWTIINQIVSTTLIMANIPPSMCNRAYRFETAGAVILMSLSSCILGLRVYSIFERSLKIGCFLGAFLVVEAAWMIFTSTLLGPLVLPPFVSDFLGFHGCIAVGGAGLKTYVSSAFWAAPLLFDATILTLTLYKITSTERHAGGKVPILQRILKSSILYFVPIACMHLVTTAMAAFTRATLKSFNPPASLAFTGIAATRLVLSLFDSSNSIKNQATGSGIFFWKSRSKRHSPLKPAPATFSRPSRPPARHFRSINDSLDLEEVGVIQQDPRDTEGGGNGASTGSKKSGTTLEIVADSHSQSHPKHIKISTSPHPHSPHDPSTGILVHSDVHVYSEGDHSPITYPPAPSPTSPRSHQSK
ncbi:hypothetical protein JCM3765_006676 [Sporobolomyces pararoseus]